jgi:hypothetical protein
MGRKGYSTACQGCDASADALEVSSQEEEIFVREEILRRGLEMDLAPPARWMGGRCPAPCLPPVGRAGGTYF